MNEAYNHFARSVAGFKLHDPVKFCSEILEPLRTLSFPILTDKNQVPLLTDDAYRVRVAQRREESGFLLTPYDKKYPAIPPQMLVATFDPRMEVVRHCLSAVGINFAVEDGKIQLVDDPQQRDAFLKRAVARIEETHSSLTLSTIFKGSPEHYFFLALKNLPARVLDLADRKLTDTLGQPLFSSGGEQENTGKGLPAIFHRSGGAVPIEIYDEDAEEKEEPIEVPHNPLEIAAIALEYDLNELADIAAEYAVRTCISDAVIEANAIAGLEARGLISDRGEGKSIGVEIVEALLHDFKGSYLDERSFSHARVRDLKRLTGIDERMSNVDFADMLSAKLTQMQVQTKRLSDFSPQGGPADGPE